MDSSLAGSGYGFDAAGLRGADDGLGDRGAVDHLRDRNGIRIAAFRGDHERLERRARHVVALRFPDLRFALRRLELAGAEETRAPLLRGRARHMGHSLEPDPAG